MTLVKFFSGEQVISLFQTYLKPLEIDVSGSLLKFFIMHLKTLEDDKLLDAVHVSK